MSAAMPKAFLSRPGEAKMGSLGANVVTFLARGAETAGIYSLTEFTLAPPPTPGPPLHLHLDAHEAVYVLEGELEVTLDEQKTIVPAGSFVYVPRGPWHTLANPGPNPTKFLTILTPRLRR